MERITTTIRVGPETRDRLLALRRHGQSTEGALMELLDAAEANKWLREAAYGAKTPLKAKAR